MPALLLGPLLRHVGARDATVWVETDAPARVTVRAGEATGQAATFRVAGHHYALVVLTGLAPGATVPYTVALDGQPVWPPAGSGRPASVVRTVDPTRSFRLAFGSCRYATPDTVGGRRRFDPDALDCLARRLARRPPAQWPDALLLLGDQVYADETSPQTRRFIAARRDVRRPPGTEVADFEEYTRLYRESWSDPDVRWLLATIPTSMIFDDHDIKDDWNTSHAWREEMAATGWWAERITGGLMAYWLYQHLGNLGPEELAADPLYGQLVATGADEAGDGAALLRRFARAADREADGGKGARWSYRRDFGRIRLLVIDSRCGRILADGRRSMVSEEEFAWLERQVADDGYDHLLVGTSLPWLLPRALSDVESWDEALCAGSRGPRLARLGERLRRVADLEHWAAFRASFDRLAGLLAAVAAGRITGRPPATVCVLSGDVHHAYIARAAFPAQQRTVAPVYQLTCSPVHNHVPAVLRWAFRASWSRPAEWLTRWLDRWTTVPPPPLEWERLAGPYFGNELATLTLAGRTARLVLERAVAGPAGPDLEPVAALALSGTRTLPGDDPT